MMAIIMSRDKEEDLKKEKTIIIMIEIQEDYYENSYDEP